MGNNVRQSKREENDLIREHDDFKSNRLMILMVSATALVVALLLMKKNIGNFEPIFILNVLLYVRIALGVIFAASLAFFIVKRRKLSDESGKYISSSVILGVSALLLIVSLVFEYIRTNGAVLFIISAFLLYFLYCFYARDFFWYSVFTVVCAGLMYSCSLATTIGLLKNVIKVSMKGFAFVIPMLVVLALIMLRRSGGIIEFRGKKIRLIRPGYNYYPFFCAAAVSIAGSIIIILFPSLLIYGLIALFAFYLLFAIIYTVKMI